MAEWRMPVFDRIMDDVKSVDRTSAEYQKGALNADDLNRIEDNYKYLMAKLRSDAIFIPHRLRNYTETVLEYVEKENSVLLEGYTQVEYIESSGTQYINTGFIPNQDTRVVLTAEFTEISTTVQSAVFGSRSANTYQFWWYWRYNSSAWMYRYASVSTNWNAGGTALGKHTFDANKNVFSVSDNSVTATSATFECLYPAYLFAVNNAGTAEYPCAFKLYSCQIYDNGTLVRNYIPCTNANGTAGLYDLVNGTFYANAGTGTFTTGAEIEPETVVTYEEITTTYTDWQENNLPWLSEINRIRANYNALVRLFLVGLGLPILPENNYLDYTEVNHWERFALLGKEMFENMEKEYIPCGTMDSGGDRLL